MMTPLLVNNQPFFGRVEEQKQFRMALHELLRSPSDETLPYLFLLYGDGGIGKSTLARRFGDIAQGERPFKGKIQLFWVDWEDEKWRPSLSVGREHIGAEAVFDTLHTVAVNHGWGAYFETYQAALKGRKEAEREAEAALAMVEERDDLAELRGASATALAKVIRAQLPIGESGELIAKAFLEAGIRVGVEKAALLRARVENRLRTRLKAEQLQLFLNPQEQLAQALADGLKGLASKQPLLIVLDTYEIVDGADRWLRMLIKAAGPNLLWIIAGRDDLVRDRLFGKTYFKGYPNDFPRRLVTVDMRRLAELDIRDYFAASVPWRPLNQNVLEAISRTTRGIPLAIREAADIWAVGEPLEAIVGDITDAIPNRQIVQKMTERYLLHCITDQNDQRALYTLAFARGDDDLLRLLLSQNAPDFELAPYLRTLERRYSSVYRQEARLHDEPAAFLLEDLKTRLRKEPWTQSLAQQAISALDVRLEELNSALPLIEERCQDDDWIKAVLDKSDYLFWLKEEPAWQWIIPRFVESVAYSRELRGGLIKTVAEWKDFLSKRGQKRLKLLQYTNNTPSNPDDQANLLREVEKLARRGWLAGEGESERRAILTLGKAQMHMEHKQYEQVLRLYEQVEYRLPEEGEELKRLLGRGYYNLSGALMWPDPEKSSVYSSVAERLLPKVVEWLPQEARAWRMLALLLGQSGKYDEAIACYEQAIQLNPTFVYAYIGLGGVYRALGRYEEAIASFKRAIELDPTSTPAHHRIGLVYHSLGRYEEAIPSFQQAIQLAPTFALPHNGLGRASHALGRYEDAIASFQQAINLDPTFTYPYHNLGQLYYQLGRYEEAIASYAQESQLHPTYAYPHICLAAIYRKLGQLEAYEKQVAVAGELTVTEKEYDRACLEAVCGNVEEALALLKVALEQRQVPREWARHEIDFEFIRDDARFQALVAE